LLYGILELVAASWFVYTPLNDFAGPLQNPLADAISFLGGMYIIVRALDNIENGLRPSQGISWWQRQRNKIHTKWQYFFIGQ
jgi:hypothetical protein